MDNRLLCLPFHVHCSSPFSRIAPKLNESYKKLHSRLCSMCAFKLLTVTCLPCTSKRAAAAAVAGEFCFHFSFLLLSSPHYSRFFFHFLKKTKSMPWENQNKNKFRRVFLRSVFIELSFLKGSELITFSSPR